MNITNENPKTPPQSEVSNALPSPLPSGGTKDVDVRIKIDKDVSVHSPWDSTETDEVGNSGDQETRSSEQAEYNKTHGKKPDKLQGNGREHDQDQTEISPESNKDSTVEDPLAEINRLKSLVAHYELQNKLLTIESYENAQRNEVESSIMQREVDRLLMEKNSKRGSLDDDGAEFDEESAAQTYRRRLRKAKLKLRDASQLIREKDDEIERLRRRLREGRQHREAMEARFTKDGDSNANDNGGLTALGILASASQAMSQDASGEESSQTQLMPAPAFRRESYGSTVTEEGEEDEDEKVYTEDTATDATKP